MSPYGFVLDAQLKMPGEAYCDKGQEIKITLIAAWKLRWCHLTGKLHCVCHIQYNMLLHAQSRFRSVSAAMALFFQLKDKYLSANVYIILEPAILKEWIPSRRVWKCLQLLSIEKSDAVPGIGFGSLFVVRILMIVPCIRAVFIEPRIEYGGKGGRTPK